MEIAVDLGERISAIKFDDLPEAAIHWSKVAIADTIACTLVGASEPCTDIVEKTLVPDRTEGPCLVLGRGRRTGALEAALVNGTSSHALDYDDINKSLGGHPSVTLVPALMALADEHGFSGAKFIEAYVAGYEMECKLGRAVNFVHYEKGWHPTATLGTLGCAAASAVMLGLTPHQTTMALTIAASMASGLKSNTGSMTKPFHAGHISRNGLFAARLAQNGFTAREHTMEHEQGFFEVFNGAGNYDIDKMFAHWADPLDVVDPGVGIKRYPSCASTHGAIDCMLELRQQGLRPEDVKDIHITIHPRRIVHTNRPLPKNPLDCKFSLQYCVARALMDGWIKLEHFKDDADKDPMVLRLLGNTRASAFTEKDPEIANQLASQVRVATTDGKAYFHKVEQAVGRGPELPVPEDQLRRKFDDSSKAVLSAEATARLWDLCFKLETLANARELTDVMDVASASVAAAE